jgi:hypothetical protein
MVGAAAGRGEPPTVGAGGAPRMLGVGGLETEGTVGAGGAARAGAGGATGITGAGGFTGAGASAAFRVTRTVSFFAGSFDAGMDGAGDWFLFSIILSLDFSGAFSNSSFLT